MSQYHNIFSFQSGLRNAVPEQNRTSERGSSANMPIFLDDEAPSPVLPSFQASQRKQFSSFSSDLRSLAFAAKSNLGLCDGQSSRSDALQSLMSYGPQSTQKDLSNPSQGQRNCYEFGSPSKTSYAPLDSGYLHPSLLSRNTQERNRPEELFSSGSSQRPTFTNQPPTPSSIKEDSQGSFASFKPTNADQDDVPFTPFKPPPQLNTVEDEDEFLYGDATPVVETPSSRTEEPLTQRQGKETRPNPGLGSWSDEESLFGEDFSTGNQHTITIHSPTVKAKEKETTSIPLKDLSWKSSHAWKDEVQVIEDFSKSHSSHIRTVEKPKDRPSPRIPEILEVSPQSSKKTSTYANAALLLKKQLDPNSLTKKIPSSEAPPGTKDPDVPKESPYRKEKEPPYRKEKDRKDKDQGIWVNVEATSKKRNVSMIDKSQYDRDISPEHREREDDNDKYVKNFYERKASRRSRSPDSPRRRSPDSYRRRSPSPGYRSRGRSKSRGRTRSPESRSRGRSRSPEYRSRGRSRGRSPESWRRGRSRSRPRPSDEYREDFRQRARSRGRSQPRFPEGSSRPDRDGKYPSKRPYSPDDRTYKDEAPKKKPIPPSVEASLAAETPEEGGLFPKSMSADMFSMFMKKPRLDASPKKATESPRTSRFPDPVRESSGPAGRYAEPPVKPIEPTKPVTRILDLSEDTPKQVGRFSDPSGSPKVVNRFVEVSSELPKPISRLAEPQKPTEPLRTVKSVDSPKPVVSKPAIPTADEHIVMQKLNFCLRLAFQTELLNQLVAEMQENEEAKKINLLAQKVESVFDANARQTRDQEKSHEVLQQQPSVPYLPHHPPPQVAPYPSVPMYPPPQIPNVTPPIAQPYPYPYPQNVMPATFPYNPMYPPPPITNQVYPGPGQMASPVDASQVPPSTSKVVSPPTRCLKTVPVLSQQEIMKVKSKELDQDMVEKFNKRVDEHNLCLKKLASLSEQSVEIKKIKDDYINNAKKVRGGGDAQFLSEIEMLQVNAATELQRTIDEMKILSQDVQEMATLLGPKKLEQIKSAPKPEVKKPAVVFGCFDSGQHFCVQCGVKFPSIIEIVKHLHSQKHLEKEGPPKSVESRIPPKVETTVTSLQPAKGIEFVKPLTALYCTLCDETLLNPLFAEQHVKGHEHTMKYMSYLRENPMYEEKQRLLVNARMQAVSKEIRMKTLEEVTKARQLILKKNQESEEKSQKVKNKLKKDQANPLEELEDSRSASTELQRKKAEIKLTLAAKPEKPKRQVIYIGRAPNFRPKADDKNTKAKDETKREDKSRAGKTSNTSSSRQDEGKDRKSYREDSKKETEKKKEVSEGKVYGCKSEAETKNKKPEVEYKSSLRKSTRTLQTVQLQLDEPKTDDPVVNQALKNIMYGTKGPDLSAIKLPEGPPLPPLPQEEPVKPKKMADVPVTHKTPEGPLLPPNLVKNTEKPKAEPLTEEEKDFILLGIDKSDMQPIAIPKRPPSIQNTSSTVENIPAPSSNVAASKNIKLPDVTVPPPNILVPPVQIPLPNLSVPPPTLQFPLPNLQVPPPNFQVPPPNVQVSPPNMQVPTPIIAVPLPNLQVPPPVLSVPPPNLQTPSKLSQNNTLQTPVSSAPKCPPPQAKSSTPDIDDMEIDTDEVEIIKIEVGIPSSNSADNKVKVKPNKDNSAELSTESVDNSKPAADVLQTLKSDQDVISTTKGQHIKGSSMEELKDGSVKDKGICTNILSSVINTVLEEHLGIPSKTSNVTITTVTSNDIKMDDVSKTVKDISCESVPTNTIVSKESSDLEKSEEIITTKSDTLEITKSVGSECSNIPPSSTSSKPTEEPSNKVNTAVETKSAGISLATENDKFESEMLVKLQSSDTENLTMSKSIDRESGKESSVELVNKLEKDNLKVINVADNFEVQCSSPTAKFNDTEEGNNGPEPMSLEIYETSQPIVQENIQSVHDSPVVLEENSSPGSELQNNPADFASAKAIPEILEDSNSSYSELLNTPCGIPKMANEQGQNKKNDPINVLNYEDICEEPLIHSIEHFMDSNEDKELQLNSLSAQELPESSLAKQETATPLQVEENVSMPLEKQELCNKPVDTLESTSDVLNASSIEAMEEQANIQNVILQDLDSKISCPAIENIPTAGTETGVPNTLQEDSPIPIKVESIDDQKEMMQNLSNPCSVNQNTPVSTKANLQKTFEEDQSISMDVENNSIPMKVEANTISNLTQNDLSISCVATASIPYLGAEADLLKICEEDQPIAIQNEEEETKISADPIVNPQVPNLDNNLLNTCFSGTGRFNRNSSLGPETLIVPLDPCIAKKSSEEYLEVLKASDESKEKGLVTDNIETANPNPLDTETTSNIKEIKNSEESIHRPISHEACQLIECSEQKKLITDEVDRLHGEAVDIHTENVANKLSSKLDDPEELQTENFGDNQINKEALEEDQALLTLNSNNTANDPMQFVSLKGCEPENKIVPGQDVLTTNEPKIEEIRTALPEVICLSEDSNSRDNDGRSVVPCLEKFDLDDSLSNSLSGDPPVLSEVLAKKEAATENVGMETAVTEKKIESDTDEYDTEDGQE